MWLWSDQFFAGKFFNFKDHSQTANDLNDDDQSWTVVCLQKAMLTSELSSYVLEIPNDAYTTLSQFWLAGHHSVKSTDSWLVDVGK